MSSPPERRSRLPKEPARRSCDGDDTSMTAPALCCGELGLDAIAECSRRGIYCAPESCAYRALLRSQLEERAEQQIRLASLTVAADELQNVGGGWLSAQLRDLRDLLSREAS